MPKGGKNGCRFKKKRAYISWGGDSGDESTGEVEEEEEEEANLCLMVYEEDSPSTHDNQYFGRGCKPGRIRVLHTGLAWHAGYYTGLVQYNKENM
ncbi:unnamed protein product [Cuscuta campestris]|uniref:Uncharacterized protein n=1 Tax=Cuscuta campestris TaxID=132261 RepID=A0A484N8M2_9ASTE|nr:unnamed protein product [Cuscuta campestris]